MTAYKLIANWYKPLVGCGCFTVSEYRNTVSFSFGFWQSLLHGVKVGYVVSLLATESSCHCQCSTRQDLGLCWLQLHKPFQAGAVIFLAFNSPSNQSRVV